MTRLVAVASARSSPGVTTTVLACASAIGGPVLVVEAGEDGGSIGPRFALPSEPGLVSMAAAGRHRLDPALVVEHSQHLPGTEGRVRVLLGPGSVETAEPLLGAVAAPLAATLTAMPGPTVALVDCGRLPARPLAAPLLAAADELLVVVRPRLDELQCLRRRLAGLEQFGPPPRLVLIGERPYAAAEVASSFGRPVAAVLADDRPAADALAGIGPQRRLARSALLRSAVGLAEIVRGGPPTPPGRSDTATGSSWPDREPETSGGVA